MKPCFFNTGTERSSEGPICRSTECLYKKRDDQVTFSGLGEGEEYFAVIYNSSEPQSFIVVSDSTVVMPRATAPPPPQVPKVKKRAYGEYPTLESIR